MFKIEMEFAGLFLIAFFLQSLGCLKLNNEKGRPLELFDQAAIARVAKQFEGANTSMPVDLLKADGWNCQMDRAIDNLREPEMFYFPSQTDVPLVRLWKGEKVEGFDLLPGIAQGDAQFYGTGTHFFNLHDIDRGHAMKVVNCNSKNGTQDKDGVIQRVGPFSSVGGFDFWPFGWKDIAHLEKRVPKGSFITFTSVHPVDHNGNVIGLPPLYIHHAYYGDAVMSYTSTFNKALSKGKLPLRSTLWNTGGDQQCLKHDGGRGCTDMNTEAEFGKSHGHLFTGGMEFQGEVNDARPLDSEPLHWWFNLEIHWSSRSLKPLSVFLIKNQYPVFDQYEVPTDRQSFFWYQGTMPKDGLSMKTYIHAHRAPCEHHFLFFATPQQLGLDKIGGWKNPWDTVDLATAGFQSFQNLRREIMRNLDNAAQTYLHECREDCSFERRPKVICDTPSKLEEVDGLLWDRTIPSNRQCTSWSFRKNDIIVGLFFHGKLDRRSLTPSLARDRTTLPAIFQQHSVYIITYEARDGSTERRAMDGERHPIGSGAPKVEIEALP